MKHKGILICLALLCCSVLVMPQVRTGIMTGKVADDQDSPLPGVTIAIGSPQMIGGKQATITNERGIFRVINLPPGTYWLKATLEGFRPYEQRDIRVRLGTTATLNIRLEVGGLHEDVLVVAETPAVDVETNALSQNFDNEYLAKLPSSRELDAFMSLTPGVVIDTNMSGSQFADRSTMGGGSRENYFSMDGTYVTDPGNGQQMIYWNYDIIDEAQVEATGHGAEYGNAAGAVVNVITKSGGNKFSGLVNFYYRDKNFRSKNHEGTGLGGPTNAIKSEYEGSLNLGGPIVKDKVWFFLSGGYIPQVTETVGFPEDINRDRIFGFSKITAQPHPRHRLSLLFNYHQDNTNHMFASQFRTPLSTLISDQWTMTYNLQWDYTISNNMLAAIRAAYVDRSTTYKSNGPGAMYYDLLSGRMEGSSGFNNEQTRDRYQLQATLNYWLEGFYGDHDIKVGFEYEKGISGYNGTMQSDYEGGPSMIYTYGGKNGMYLMGYGYDPPNIKSEDTFRGLSGYVKDTWKIGRLTLNLGTRLNSIKGIIPVQEKVSEPITEFSFTNFEPRLGFAYDLSTGSRLMAVKFHYGKYFLNTVALGMLNPNGWDMVYYLWLGYWFPYMSYEAGVANLDPDLKRPFTRSYVLSFEVALTRNMALRINGIHKLYKDFIGSIDLNLTEDWYYPIEVDNPIDNSTFTYWLLKDNAPSSSPYHTNPDGPFRKYWALQFILEHAMSNNIQFLISYTYSSTKGNVGQAVWSGGGAQAPGMWNNPNTLYNKYRNGALDLDKPHQIKFSGVYYAPWGIIVGLNYIGYSGYPYARSFFVDIGQDQYTFEGEVIGAQRTPFMHMFDLRIEKNFPVGQISPRVFFEVFNLLNSNTATAYGSVIGSSYYDEVTSILPPRILRLGIGLSF